MVYPTGQSESNQVKPIKKMGLQMDAVAKLFLKLVAGEGVFGL
jgi:hypothetical protein